MRSGSVHAAWRLQSASGPGRVGVLMNSSLLNMSHQYNITSFFFVFMQVSSREYSVFVSVLWHPRRGHRDPHKVIFVSNPRQILERFLNSFWFPFGLSCLMCFYVVCIIFRAQILHCVFIDLGMDLGIMLDVFDTISVRARNLLNLRKPLLLQ